MNLVVDCLLDLHDQELVSPFAMVELSEVTLLNILRKYSDDEELGTTILELSQKLVAPPFNGVVPSSKEALLTLVDEMVVSLMMTQAFHSNEIVVGLHARKILTALDMYDWESTETTNKADVKMKAIPAGHVQKSLQTWIPKGSGREFHDVMESLGAALDCMKQGSWGTIQTVINSQFPTKHKHHVKDMVNTIIQFYKATKSKKGTSTCSG